MERSPSTLGCERFLPCWGCLRWRPFSSHRATCHCTRVYHCYLYSTRHVKQLAYNLPQVHLRIRAHQAMAAASCILPPYLLPARHISNISNSAISFSTLPPPRRSNTWPRQQLPFEETPWDSATTSGGAPGPLRDASGCVSGQVSGGAVLAAKKAERH